MCIRDREESSEIGAQVTLTLLDTVEQGGSLACALRATDAFPRYMVNMVEIGEASGKLEDVLSSCLLYTSQQVFGLQAHIICLLVACAGSVRIVFIEQGNASLQFLRCVKEELGDRCV